MGRDIHIFVEFHLENEPDTWTLLAEFWAERWIGLFEALGGGKGDPLIPLRGIPSGLSIRLRWRWREAQGDAHHVSWLTSEEAMRVSIAPGLHAGYAPEWRAVVQAMQSVERTTGLYARVIYWFDN